MQKIRLGISACLLGERVRYDAGHKLDPFLAGTFGRYVEWVPVCPEVEYGLPVPREPMRLEGAPESPRLVTIHSGIDHTKGMGRWAEKRLAQLAHMGLYGFIFESKSPSSGMQGVKVHAPSGRVVRKGAGIYAKAFMDRFPFMPVEDDERLHAPALRDNFIERIFVYARWREFEGTGGTIRALIAFHSDHKFLILARSPKHYTLLGRLVADSKSRGPGALRLEYLRILTEALRLEATTRKNLNVLQHLMGFLKKRLSDAERRELHEAVQRYVAGEAPLIVPKILLVHYAGKYDAHYLKRQHYLNPHPLELMMRNHA